MHHLKDDVFLLFGLRGAEAEVGRVSIKQTLAIIDLVREREVFVIKIIALAGFLLVLIDIVGC